MTNNTPSAEERAMTQPERSAEEIAFWVTDGVVFHGQDQCWLIQNRVIHAITQERSKREEVEKEFEQWKKSFETSSPCEKHIEYVLPYKKYIKVCKYHVYISRSSRIESHFVEVFFDRENKAIKLNPSNIGFSIKQKYQKINCSLSKKMPVGYYIYNDELNCFILAERLRKENGDE